MSHLVVFECSILTHSCICEPLCPVQKGITYFHLFGGHRVTPVQMEQVESSVPCSNGLRVGDIFPRDPAVPPQKVRLDPPATHPKHLLRGYLDP